MFQCDVKLNEKNIRTHIKNQIFKKKEGKQFTAFFFKCIILMPN
jgi:hypothetical protein